MSATGVNADTEPYYLSNSKNLFAQTLLAYCRRRLLDKRETSVDFTARL
jgi:hypothetical protein